MNTSTEKPFLLAIRGKILAAFLLTGLAIILALGITYFSFKGLLGTVDALASPNEKLTILHQFFQNVAQLDQRQRAEAIKNPSKPYADFLLESRKLLLMIDSLQTMDWKNPHQQERLNAMEEILTRRDKLFLSYLKFRAGFIVNKKFSEKLDSLSTILADAKIWTDSNVTTTQRKIITTTFLPQPESNKTKDKGFFSRLFKKKEEKPSDTKVEVKEELSVTVDTLSIGQRDSALLAVDRVMKNLGENQRLQSKYMLQHELDLINANTILINQLLNILHETEEEELSLMRINNTAAAKLVNTSIKRIGIIMIVFFIGGALLIFLILTDITRTNFYRLQLVKAKEEAEQLSQVKQRFLANMSHEIRTPLQSILGYSEQLKNTDHTNAAALQAINSSSEHLLQIVNEILDYSRINSGKLTLEYEPFSIAQIVDDVSTVMRVQAENRSLSFLLEKTGPIHSQVMGDAFRLRQILFNVLGNAVKFTETGSVTLSIEAIPLEKQLHCLFIIKDTGIGMNAADIDKAFQQFEQANPSVARHYGGTGLGLTIVKTLVEAQHGKLQIDSEPAKGTTITIDLIFDNASAMAEENIIPVISNKATFHGKVLVVDDDPLILRLCSMILEKNNIPYRSFQDSTQVLEASLSEDDIHLVLLDIRMPGISGLDLCRDLREKLPTNARFIALTAHVLPSEKEKLLQNGFDDVLNKPFRESALLDLIGVPLESVIVQEPLPSLEFLSIKKMTMGDDTLFRSILKQFVDETHDDSINLDKHLTNLNAGMVREIVHKLAGRTGQMGLTVIANQFKIFEADLSIGKDLSLILADIIKSRDALGEILLAVKKIYSL